MKKFLSLVLLTFIVSCGSDHAGKNPDGTSGNPPELTEIFPLMVTEGFEVSCVTLEDCSTCKCLMGGMEAKTLRFDEAVPLGLFKGAPVEESGNGADINVSAGQNKSPSVKSRKFPVVSAPALNTCPPANKRPNNGCRVEVVVVDTLGQTSNKLFATIYKSASPCPISGPCAEGAICVKGECVSEDIVVVDADSDKDGINDLKDNCPFVANADQKDLNKNSVGDDCEKKSGSSSTSSGSSGNSGTSSSSSSGSTSSSSTSSSGGSTSSSSSGSSSTSSSSSGGSSSGNSSVGGTGGSSFLLDCGGAPLTAITVNADADVHNIYVDCPSAPTSFNDQPASRFSLFKFAVRLFGIPSAEAYSSSSDPTSATKPIDKGVTGTAGFTKLPDNNKPNPDILSDSPTVNIPGISEGGKSTTQPPTPPIKENKGAHKEAGKSKKGKDKSLLLPPGHYYTGFRAKICKANFATGAICQLQFFHRAKDKLGDDTSEQVTELAGSAESGKEKTSPAWIDSRCPKGQVVTGLKGGIGDALDSLQLICGTPAEKPKLPGGGSTGNTLKANGELCTLSSECSSGYCQPIFSIGDINNDHCGDKPSWQETLTNIASWKAVVTCTDPEALAGANVDAILKGPCTKTAPASEQAACSTLFKKVWDDMLKSETCQITDYTEAMFVGYYHKEAPEEIVLCPAGQLVHSTSYAESADGYLTKFGIHTCIPYASMFESSKKNKTDIEKTVGTGTETLGNESALLGYILEGFDGQKCSNTAEGKYLCHLKLAYLKKATSGTGTDKINPPTQTSEALGAGPTDSTMEMNIVKSRCAEGEAVVGYKVNVGKIVYGITPLCRSIVK